MTDATNHPSISVELLAMFMWQGFMDASPWTDTESERYGGRIGAAEDLLPAIGILRRTLNAHLAADPDAGFPGVLDYEVSEPLGAWYRLNRYASPNAFAAEAQRLVERFLSPPRPEPVGIAAWPARVHALLSRLLRSALPS